MIFFTVLCVVLLSVIFFIQRMLPSLFADRQRGRHFCRKLLLIDGLLVAALAAGHFLPVPDTVAGPALLGFTMAFMFQLLLGFFIFLSRFGRWCYRKLAAEPLDPSRRRLLTHAAAYPLAAAAAAAYGGLEERTDQVVREQRIGIAGQNTGLDGFRLVQLSDIHLGLFFSLSMLKKLLEQASDLGGTALVITGDLFDDDAMNAEAAEIVDSYRQRFPAGIWFCYGNHEYFRDIGKTKAALAKTHIHVLLNNNACVVDGKKPLYFAGADYPHDRAKFDALAKSMTDEALQGIPAHAMTVLLAHHPDFIDQGAAHGVSLVLTGHTHGGQLGLFGIPLVPPVFKYMRGLYRVKDTLGYVHSGNGSWFPYRFGCPPEIACFTLREEIE